MQNSRIYYLPVEKNDDPALLAALLETIPAERREKALHFRQVKEQLMSAAASALLMYAFRKAGLKNKEPAFMYNKYGKPFLISRKLSFNLSHTHGAALCAVAEGGHEIGCDVEIIRSPVLQIAKSYFCEPEKEHLFSLPDEAQQNRLFYRYWTVKESVLKAIGCGITIPLNSFCISFENDEIHVDTPDFPEVLSACFCELQAGENLPALSVPEHPETLYYREYTADEAFCCSCGAFRREYLPERLQKVALSELITM